MNPGDKFDLIAIGGGLAGLTAGLHALELGLSVCVLEKGSADRYSCNSRFSGGTLHVCLDDIMADAGKLRAAIDRITRNTTPPALADVMANDGRRAVRWLQSQGVRFMKASPAPYHSWVLAPPRPPRPGLEWEGRGSDVTMRTLCASIEKRGGKLIRGARATELIMHDGRCTGVRADINGVATELAATAVVIADGGFQGNPEMVGEHISPKPASLKQRGAGTGAGDGLKMARAVGAAVTDLGWFYGHVLSRDAMSKEILWPYPVLDSVIAVAIAVDIHGKRFVDEGESGPYSANIIAKQPDPLATFAVFDDAIWNGAAKRDLIPPNPHLPNNGATVLQAPTLEALATQAGIASGALAETVRAYNDAVKNVTTATLTPSRSADKYTPQPIAKAPFYAVPLCAGITYTMGGIAVDENGCVQSTKGGAIPGLYAAGSCVGGVDGGPRAGYVGGLSKAGVLGLRSAEHIARSLGKAVA